MVAATTEQALIAMLDINLSVFTHGFICKYAHVCILLDGALSNKDHVAWKYYRANHFLEKMFWESFVSLAWED
jgi:hypothetical protein